MKNTIFLLISMLIFTGCSDTEKSTSQDETTDAKPSTPTVINGYTLPPEPDPTINNATLLGIDTNNNGVRDDVERKIIIKYQKPIEIEVMMAYSRIAQEVLESSLDYADAQKLEGKFSNPRYCRLFLRREHGIKIESIVKHTEDKTYNTKERVKKYLKFNLALSGGSYGGGPADWNAEACDFDVEQMLKDRK